MPHVHADLLNRAFEAVRNGDLDALDELWDDDIVWHDPGESPVAGEHYGKDAAIANLRRITDATDDYSIDVHSVLADDDHAVALVTENGRRDGRELSVDGVHVAHVRDGKVTELWTLSSDQAATDAFWT